MESLERIKALVNYGWTPVAACGQPAGTGPGGLMHCILALRSLPAAEREAWRGLLDQYVFGAEHPLAYHPLARRGMLGDLTPEQRDAPRASIRRYL